MWRKKHFTAILTGAVLVAITIASCSKKDNSMSGTDGLGTKSGARTTANSATVNIHLMDDPGKFDAVYVDIKSIRVQTSDTTWDTLALFRPGIYNLLNFKDDVDTLITSALLFPGQITKMEMILGGNNSVVVKGKSYPLNLNSAADSMVRIWLRFGRDHHDGLGFGIGGHMWDRDMDDEDFDDGTLPMVAGGVYDVYADFDVAMSVHRTGDHDFFDWDKDGDHGHGTVSYILRPVVRAFVKTNTGSLRGQVLPLAAMPTIYASNATDVFTALPNSIGYYSFPMLPAGTYQVVIVPSDTTYSNDTLSGVVITANNLTYEGVITLH